MVSKEYIQRANEKYREMLTLLDKTNDDMLTREDKLSMEYKKCGSWVEGDKYCSNHQVNCGKVDNCSVAHMRRDYKT
jgi:hypothetical protein